MQHDLHPHRGRQTMQAGDHLELERAPSQAQKQAKRSGVKSILLHVQNDTSLDLRMDTALSLARACDAHLSCLHVTPIEAYVAFDGFGGIFVMTDVIKTIEEEEVRLRKSVEADLANEDVSWDYTEITGNLPSQILRHSALADLVVTGRRPHNADFAGPTLGLLGDLLHRCKTPIFIAADQGAPPDPTGTVLIAWDGSVEAANAVRASVGLLQLASDVQILQVREDKDEAFPTTRVLEFLSRHGIHAEMLVEQSARRASGQEFVTGSLIAHAKEMKASYLVMGGYNHSRLGEFVFGGVTRNMLAASPVPLLIAH
jgi:nucleotide-binding universal stress UspA family protein